MMVLLITFMLYTVAMSSASYSGPLEPLTDQERLVRDRLEEHVVMLAETIGERNVFCPQALEASAEYIDTMLVSAGYEVSSQYFEVQSRLVRNKMVRNIDAKLIGTEKKDEIIVVGAHYDSVMGCPGANDNGSGVAALLEIARLLKDKKLPRTVLFVAFVNEEPPFFKTRNMGSRVYAKRSRELKENIKAMYCLETIGFYTDTPCSQHYPPPVSFFYPRTGNFIGFVTNTSHRDLLRQTVSSFRKHTAFPSEGAAVPGWLVGVSWSDHWSFWKEGYPALVITDTAFFRYKHYHTTEDTPDKLIYDRFARVTAGIARTVEEMAGGSERQL
ncbi:MAG: M20/M25/M40 family metallo-hydrolase [Proteobacteria bacterium]|nr:M20/M25/M40 family metallo-hydrolase [Pseudomonadota bacterium]